jgi:hypothetical protein
MVMKTDDQGDTVSAVLLWELIKEWTLIFFLPKQKVPKIRF